MIKVDRVELYHVRLPLVQPFETSFGREDARDTVIVAVRGGGLMGWGEAATATQRTPFHGSSPWSTSSGKIHRLPASVAASSVARPTALWSGVFQKPPWKVSRWLRVMTSSGRCRRIAAAISRRRGRPYSITPSR